MLLTSGHVKALKTNTKENICDFVRNSDEINNVFVVLPAVEHRSDKWYVHILVTKVAHQKLPDTQDTPSQALKPGHAINMSTENIQLLLYTDFKGHPVTGNYN